jgi:hypothetical protein
LQIPLTAIAALTLEFTSMMMVNTLLEQAVRPRRGRRQNKLCVRPRTPAINMPAALA